MTEIMVDSQLRELFYRYDRVAPLEPEVRVLSEDQGVRTTHFVISSSHGQRVPGLIWTPLAERNAGETSGPLPVVMLQHGAGSCKEDGYISLTARRWAQQGVLCVAIDANEHGERPQTVTDKQALWTYPWLRRDHAIQMCTDLQRTLDYLETRADADLARIGYLGFSMGTINGVAFVALDRRVKTAVFAIGGGRLIELRPPSDDADRRTDLALVAEIVDPVHFAPLIAPRPVLMVNGKRDETVPPAAGQALFDALAEPKRIIWYDGGHTELSGRELKAIWSFFQETL